MKDMTSEEYRRFMMDRPRTGKLATVRKDGRPHIAPIWFVLDGDDLVFTTWHESVKAANLKVDNRVSLCVDDEEPPYAFAIVEGSAQVDTSLDSEELLHWATEIARRYMGNDLAAAYGKRNGVKGELLVRIKPTRTIAKANIAD